MDAKVCWLNYCFLLHGYYIETIVWTHVVATVFYCICLLFKIHFTGDLCMYVLRPHQIVSVFNFAQILSLELLYEYPLC